MIKRFILNADDFGISKDTNRAVQEGYQHGLLKSVSLMANGEAFDDAVNSIVPQCENLGVGIHLNITFGLPLCTDLTTMIDSSGKFNCSLRELFIKAYNPKEKEFMPEIEREFRRQIEKVMSKTKVTHIDSHNHIHAIPKIFDLVCRLAKEYGIKQVRTHFERPYIVPDVQKHLNWTYPLNVLKVLFFELLTIYNESLIHKYELKTNDYLVGLTYASIIDALAISYGVMSVKNSQSTVEAFIHPYRYEDGTVNNRFDEFILTKNKKLKEKIEKLGFEITNYVEKEA